MYGRMFHAYRCYISIASINSNRRGWSRRIIFCKIPNDSKNFDTFFITPRSFLLFISNLHCLIKQLKNHAIVRKPIFLTIFAHFLKKQAKIQKKKEFTFFCIPIVVTFPNFQLSRCYGVGGVRAFIQKQRKMTSFLNRDL